MLIPLLSITTRNGVLAFSAFCWTHVSVLKLECTHGISDPRTSEPPKPSGSSMATADGTGAGNHLCQAVGTCLHPESRDDVVTPTPVHVPVVGRDKVISAWSPRPAACTEVIPVSVARCSPNALMKAVQKPRNPLGMGTAMVTTVPVCAGGGWSRPGRTRSPTTGRAFRE